MCISSRDLDEQHADDNDDEDSDTFCEPVPELSRKLQEEHHQCVRLLIAVYGLSTLEEDGIIVLQPIFEA